MQMSKEQIKAYREQIKAVKNRKQLRALSDDQGFIRRPNRKNPSIFISKAHEKGQGVRDSIFRADVRLDHCVEMSVKEAVHVLLS